MIKKKNTRIKYRLTVELPTQKRWRLFKVLFDEELAGRNSIANTLTIYKRSPNNRPLLLIIVLYVHIETEEEVKGCLDLVVEEHAGITSLCKIYKLTLKEAKAVMLAASATSSSNSEAVGMEAQVRLIHCEIQFFIR